MERDFNAELKALNAELKALDAGDDKGFDRIMAELRAARVAAVEQRRLEEEARVREEAERAEAERKEREEREAREAREAAERKAVEEAARVAREEAEREATQLRELRELQAREAAAARREARAESFRPSGTAEREEEDAVSQHIQLLGLQSPPSHLPAPPGKHKRVPSDLEEGGSSSKKSWSDGGVTWLDAVTPCAACRSEFTPCQIPVGVSCIFYESESTELTGSDDRVGTWHAKRAASARSAARLRRAPPVLVRRRIRRSRKSTPRNLGSRPRVVGPARGRNPPPTSSRAPGRRSRWSGSSPPRSARPSQRKRW